MVGKLFHWGPLLALGIIKLVSWTTIHCTAHWLPLTQSFLGVINTIIFFGLAFLTIYNFMCSIFIGPGFVPLHWRPKKKEDEQLLQFCLACDGYKAPRSHHCRKCGRCVLKMDHHCPWINNCVGHHNHRHFVSFLFFAICGSLHSFGLLILTVYKIFIVNIYYVKAVPAHMRLSLTWFVLCIFSIGMTLGVFFALSFLLYIQNEGVLFQNVTNAIETILQIQQKLGHIMKSILKNCTGIEDWILEKADERRHIDPTLPVFIFPYHLGWRENIRQVFSSSEFSDGISWKVRPGCSEYDLTTEQRKQKELKKMRKRPYKVVQKFSGAIFPVVNGFCTCLRPPCSTEKRMHLHVDETILVTRYQKYWLFGERTVEKNEIPEKGWFPKSCVVPISDYSNHGYVPKAKKDL